METADGRPILLLLMMLPPWLLWRLWILTVSSGMWHVNDLVTLETRLRWTLLHKTIERGVQLTSGGFSPCSQLQFESSRCEMMNLW